ncbi:MAG: sulfurtransferase TusA family protein [Elusimicrobiota bacterium]
MSPEVIKLNLESEICPYTIIKSIKKCEEIKEGLDSGGQILEVTVEHSPVQDNFPGEFQRRGYRVDFNKIDNAKWVVTIKK